MHLPKNDSISTHFFYYRATIFLILGIVLIITYQNSLSGTFVFDDFPTIINSEYISISSLTLPEIKNVFSTYQNSHTRVIANISFAATSKIHFFAEL
jgi:hypothetical protein